MMRMLLHGLLVLCSVAVVLTISEGGLRLLVEGQVGAGDAKGDDEPDRGEKWIRREQRTGWAPLEGANVERRSPDGAPFRMRVNSTGRRGAELGKAPPDERRVLFLGDSLTMSSYLAAPLPIKRFWWNEHISQGTLAGAGGRWAESAREFKRAIDFLPGEPVAYYNLGRVYQQTKQEQLAKVAYEKALAVDASFTPARQKLKTLRP